MASIAAALPLRDLGSARSRTATEPAILVEGLTKRYGTSVAVDGLSFAVERGEVFALLGPNGAGKTTTIEILEGYRTADSGTVRVLGQDPRQRGDLRQRVGVMLQQSAIYPNIQVLEALRMFCAYYARPADPQALLGLIGLEEKAGARFKTLSGGQKQRLSLGLALAGNPDLVFLDEPTASMDPQARLVTWEVIGGMRARGVTLVLTTHYLEEAQALCNRVAMLQSGKVVALDTMAALIKRVSGSQLLLWLAPAQGQSRVQLPASLTPLISHVDSQATGCKLTLRVTDFTEVEPILAALRQHGLVIEEMQLQQADLEDVFLQIMDGSQ